MTACHNLDMSNPYPQQLETLLFENCTPCDFLESVKPLELRATSLLTANPHQILEFNKCDNEYFSKLNSGKKCFSSASVDGDKVVSQYGLTRKDVTHEYFIGAHQAKEYVKENDKFEDKIVSDLDVDLSLFDINRIKMDYKGNTLHPRRKLQQKKLGSISQNVADNLGLNVTHWSMDMLNLKNQFGGLNIKHNEYTETFLPLIKSLRLSKEKAALNAGIDKEISLSRRNIQDSDEEYYNSHIEEFLSYNEKTGAPESDLPRLKYSHARSNPVSLPEINKAQVNLNSGRESKSGSIASDVALSVASLIEENKYIRTEKSISSFKKRLQYGKNLEQNWFKELLLKSTEKEAPKNNIPLRMDLFYSPEPGTDSDDSDNTKSTDRTEPGLNGPEIPPPHGNKHISELLRQQSELFSSTDVLMGEDDELEKSSDSDIEIVLKKNRLVQKKVKHKMRKKRRKKKERLNALLPNRSTIPEHLGPTLTDAEIRALRLKIRKRNPPPILKGKRKFLQVANAVMIFIRFRNMLWKIRERRRKKRIRRLKKKSKHVTWKSEDENEYTPYEREPRSPTLKDKFLMEIGWKLIDDIEKLPLPQLRYMNKPVTDTGSGDDEAPRTSLFALELEDILSSGICIPDDVGKIRRSYHRRLSDSCLIQPSLFNPNSPLGREKKYTRSRSMSKSKKKHRSRSRSRAKSPAKKKRTNRRRSSGKGQISCPTDCEQDDTDVIFDKRGLQSRRSSLDRNKMVKGKYLELSKLLEGIDMPAKDVRIQILERKMRKQKRKKATEMKFQASFHTQTPAINADDEIRETENHEKTADINIKQEYVTPGYVTYNEKSNVPKSPFVSCGVAWNYSKYRKPAKQAHWTTEDVERAMDKVTRLFLEMKDVRYLRLTKLDQAIIDKLDEIRDSEWNRKTNWMKRLSLNHEQ